MLKIVKVVRSKASVLKETETDRYRCNGSSGIIANKPARTFCLRRGKGYDRDGVWMWNRYMLALNGVGVSSDFIYEGRKKWGLKWDY